MTDDATLQALLGRIALQDRRALRALYDAIGGRLLATVLRLLGDRAAAEDVVQDTFVAVWTRAARFPVLQTSPLAWLTAMARNRAIDVLRARRPEVPLVWQDSRGDEHVHDAPDESGTPLDRLLERQVQGRLGACIEHLDEGPKHAVLMAYYEGLTHEQLALELRKPLGTIKTWLRRSLQHLRDCVDGPQPVQAPPPSGGDPLARPRRIHSGDAA